MYFIGDIGSCHMGKKEYALKAVERAKEIELDCLKFQLFPNIPKYIDSGNIYLPYEWWGDIWSYASHKKLTVSSSFFDDTAFQMLLECRPKFIKFAYSQKEEIKKIEKCLEMGITPMVSCDVMSLPKIPKNATKLYCIPEYPVRYEIAWDGIFERFDGFSDHTLGWRQTINAILAGAKIIEKHMKLNNLDEKCPDANFALPPYQFEKLIQEGRNTSKILKK